jgi:hypothetical protein
VAVRNPGAFEALFYYPNVNFPAAAKIESGANND